MIKSAFKARPRMRLLIGVTLGATAIVAVTGAFALRTLMARPGEAALRFVPADSVLVASIDLVPSATQALAFKQIDDALSRNGMDHLFEKSVLELADQSKTTQDLRPLILRSGAICLTGNAGSKPGGQSGLAFVAVTDGRQANQILQKDAYPKFYKGLKYYKTGKSSMLLMVVDDLLVLTDKPEQFEKVKEIQDGSAKSITTVPEFVAAKQNIADDANIMVYVSPKLADQLMGDSAKKVNLPSWAAFGLAIRDGGIGLSCTSKMDLATNPVYKSLSAVAGVRNDLFQIMPTGSYGMIAVSNPASYFDVAKASLTDEKAAQKQLADMEDGVQKSLGLSIQKDLLPALKGDAIAAVYPSQTRDAAGMDVLLVVDDTNGADPAEAVDRFQAFAEQQTAKEGDAPKLFDEKPIPGGREFRINDKMQADMRKSLGDSVGNGVNRKDALVGNKTVVFAMVGKTVIASTSQELLDRTLASYQSKTGGLVGDAKFAPYEKTLLDGSQTMMAFSLSRIAEGVKNTVGTSSMNGDSKKMFESAISVFESLKDPLFIKGKVSPDGTSSGGVFIPMDYDKMINLVGDQKNKGK